MKRVLAIARLTFWEGIRMKIVLVFIVVLVFVVLRLPFALRGDETLSGRLQTFLSYSLGAMALFMSLATIFFSCATLTTDIRERSIHLVLTKPVSRFQVLLGKWLGVNLLNVLMVVLAGLVIYSLAVFIKSRPEQFMRDRVKLNDTVWTSRAATRPTAPDFDREARERVEALVEQGRTFTLGKEGAVREIAKELEEDWKRVEPREAQLYEFAGPAVPDSSDTAYEVRFRAVSVPRGINNPLDIIWVIIDPETGVELDRRLTEERSAIRHHILTRTHVLKNGKVQIAVLNPPTNRGNSIYFEGNDGLEILYRVGSFEMNFARNLLLVVLRLAFLSALGLFFGTFVSFPVACVGTLFVLGLCMIQPFLLDAIGANVRELNKQTDPYYGLLGQVLDRLVTWVLLFILGISCWQLGLVSGGSVRIGLIVILAALEVANLELVLYSGAITRSTIKFILAFGLPNFAASNGVPKLIDGYAIPLGLIVRAAGQTIVYGLMLLILPGWLVFRSREIAEVTV